MVGVYVPMYGACACIYIHMYDDNVIVFCVSDEKEQVEK